MINPYHFIRINHQLKSCQWAIKTTSRPTSRLPSHGAKKNPAPPPGSCREWGPIFFLTLPPDDSSHQAWAKLKVLVSVKSSMSALWETVKSCRIEVLFVMDLTFIRAILVAICCPIISEDDNMLQILEHLQDWITSADGSADHTLLQIYAGS